VSPDQTRVVLCGESYSPQNFVDKPIQAYVMVVRAQDGGYLWGRYYQDRAANASIYLGLANRCVFVSDQKILISGQVNFYRAFIGVINATDGTMIQTAVFESENEEYKVGYTTRGLGMDGAGNILAGIYFLKSAVSIVRLTPGRILRTGQLSYPEIDWKTQIGRDDLAASSGSVLCIDPLDNYVYAGLSI